MHLRRTNEGRNINEFAEEKVQRIVEKFIDDTIGVRVRLASSRHMQTVTASVFAGPIYSVVATDSSENIYEAVEGVCEKIEKQIRRKKKRLKRRRRKVRLKLISDEDENSDGEMQDTDLKEEVSQWRRFN